MCFCSSASGVRKGRVSRRRKGGGVAVYLEIEEGGGVSDEGRQGGANFFFSGPKFPPIAVLPFVIDLRFRFVYFLSSLRAVWRQKHESARRVRFPQIPDRVPKGAENRNFCLKSA